MQAFLNHAETLEFLQVSIPEIDENLSLELHQRNQPKLRKYQCKKCRIRIETLSGFLLHLNDIHNIKLNSYTKAITKASPKEKPSTKVPKPKPSKAIKPENSKPSIPVVTNPATCPVCENVYKTKRDFQRHYKRMHGKVIQYNCRFCGKWFQRTSDGLVHERKVHRGLVEQEKSFKCSLCIRGFDTKKFLDQHLAQHQSGELTCKFCSKEFYYSSLRVTHETTCHSSDNIDNNDLVASKRFECHYCGLSFSRKGSLVAHFTRHVTLSEYICHICAQSFRRKDGLQRHVRNVHSGDEGEIFNNINATIKQAIACQHCDLTFTSLRNLNLHKRKTHTQPELNEPITSELTKDKERLQCMYCPRTFLSLRFLQSHELSHNKVFACKICNKTLANASNLREHEKLHKTKEYKCEVCGKSFHQKTGVLRHQRDTHSVTKNYQCNKCPRKFKHSTEYHIHKREHDDPDLKKCNICFKEFASRPSYFIHRRNAHPNLIK